MTTTMLPPSDSAVPSWPGTAARRRRLDPLYALVLPAAVFMLAVFVYPFLYGLILSFRPASGGWLSNYLAFFTTERLWHTIPTTLQLAVPATLINLGLALPLAYQLRIKSRYQKLITAILVVPMTLGTVLVADGMLAYLGPKGWLAHALQFFRVTEEPLRLTHNFRGVLISLVISGFPFVFLLVLSYITGIDPVLARAAATLGASPSAQFRHVYLPLLAPGLAMAFCLAFVQAFSVFPSAVLLGAPAGPTRVISIAAYEAAFERYDYSMASCVAMVMGFVQLVVVGGALGLRHLLYRGPMTAGKG
jgi:putative spermidine/putrescine transport system permease protein